MCVATPGRIVAIEGLLASVDFHGVRRDVRLDVIDAPVAVGDYVLSHVGFAIHRIPEREIERTLEIFARVIELESAGAPATDREAPRT